MKIGILALQGAVEAHKQHFSDLGCELIAVKTSEAISDKALSGLVIPGGESSTMLKLIGVYRLQKSLNEFSKSRPIWGVCAGSILMASTVKSPQQDCFGWMNFCAIRNAYGSQLESFVAPLSSLKDAAFIRAPQFADLGAEVEVLDTFENKAVWLRQGRHMATAFHPELSKDSPSSIHRYFVEEICGKSANPSL